MNSNSDTTIETAAQRLAKGRDLLRKLGDHFRPAYDAFDAGKKMQFLELFEELSETVNRYWDHDEVWDSQLIQTVGSIPNPGGRPDPLRFKTHELSTTRSVMDKARELYGFNEVTQ